MNVNDSQSYNFFFHPFQMLKHKSREHEVLAIFAILTHIGLTFITRGLWQIPFWLVDYFKGRKIEIIDTALHTKADRIDDAAQKILSSDSSSGVSANMTSSLEAASPDDLIFISNAFSENNTASEDGEKANEKAKSSSEVSLTKKKKLAC